MGSRLMAVRPIRDTDLAAVVALETSNQPAPWSEGVFVDELAADNRIYLLVEEDDRVLAYGGVMVVADEAHVTNLLVDPAARRRGLGRALLTSLITSAVEAGARHLTLEVRASNQPARALYADLGLAPVGVRPGYYGDEDALILWVHDIDRPEFLESLR
jgi:[ribosomal protein S18]-alanine N-acetyltransferase